jgi:hypothetical protein
MCTKDAQASCLLVGASNLVTRMLHVWGSKGVCRLVSRSIAAYLVKAWDVRNSCKHRGAPSFFRPEGGGRGADGVDAMA